MSEIVEIAVAQAIAPILEELNELKEAIQTRQPDSTLIVKELNELKSSHLSLQSGLNEWLKKFFDAVNKKASGSLESTLKKFIKSLDATNERLDMHWENQKQRTHFEQRMETGMQQLLSRSNSHSPENSQMPSDPSTNETP
jgi:hypothetical protein